MLLSKETYIAFKLQFYILSALAFPGNRTHDLGVGSAMLYHLSYRKARTRKYDHVSLVLSTLHWLPIKLRIDFKILLISYKALNGLAPQYLNELLSRYSPPLPLRSQNSGNLIIPRISNSTAGGRSFSYLAPKLWNNLPNTVQEADTLCQFKSRLKTHLFNLAYI